MFFILGQDSSKARRARMHASRLALGGRGPVGPKGQVVPASGEGGFSGRWVLGNNGRLLIILADNYNHTTNDPTTEAQSAQRTHRDFSKAIPEGPVLPSLRATGSSAGQPQGRCCCRRSGAQEVGWTSCQAGQENKDAMFQIEGQILKESSQMSWSPFFAYTGL